MTEVAKDEEEYIKIQANFALKLLKEQTQLEKLKSSILSPISISIGLAIIYNGASKETAKQISNVISGGKSQESINKYFSETFKQLQSNEESEFKLKTVNHLFSAKEYKILGKFIEIAKNYYNGEFSQLDFQNNLEGAREEVNDFVESATNKLIKDMIPEGLLKHKTCLLIVNAMYFLGEWVEPFQPNGSRVELEKFYVDEDLTRKVEYMESFGKINY